MSFFPIFIILFVFIITVVVFKLIQQRNIIQSSTLDSERTTTDSPITYNVNQTRSQSGNIQTRSHIVDVQTRNGVLSTSNNNGDIQTETFFIPTSLLRKVYLNQDGQFVFTEPCTIQIKVILEPKYYFELMFFDFPITSLLFLGLAPPNFSSALVPGLFDKTISLEASRGDLLKEGNSEQWNSVGKFKNGDVLGVAIETITGTIYTYKILFIKNGVPGSPVEFTSDSYLTPTVHSTAKCCFNINFGQIDYIYDLNYISQKAKASSSIALPPAEELPSYEK